MTEVTNEAPTEKFVLGAVQLEFPEKVRHPISGKEVHRSMTFLVGEGGCSMIRLTDNQYMIHCVDNTGLAFPINSIFSSSFRLITVDEARQKVEEMVAKMSAEEKVKEVEAPEEINPNGAMDNVVDLAKARKNKNKK